MTGGKLRVFKQKEGADVGNPDEEPGEEERSADPHLGVDPLPGGRLRHQRTTLVAEQVRLLQFQEELDGRVLPSSADTKTLILGQVVPLVRQRAVRLRLHQVHTRRL